MVSLFHHLSCVIKDEKTSSTPDFLGIADYRYTNYSTRYSSSWDNATHEDDYNLLADQLSAVTVPTWLSMYFTLTKNGSTNGLVDDGMRDTAVLYNTSNNILTPMGPLTGANRFGW